MVTLDKHIWQIAPTDRDQGRSTQIISSMLEMAQSLHLPVEVEGVETNEQANMLRQMGARYAQGFLYYRPMPAKDFEALLDGGNTMVAITTDTLARKTPPPKGEFASIS